jgi:hypothetical protein
MPIENLSFWGAPVSDVSILKAMPLKLLTLDFRPYRDAEMLRSMKGLFSINEKPVAEFWKEADAKQAAFDAWCEQVAAMPAEKQVDAVAAKLKELNPRFDGRMLGLVGIGPPVIEGGVVTGLRFCSDNVADIAPVRALKGLKALAVDATNVGKSNLDLYPLAGTKLTLLQCIHADVADLSPLKGLPLTFLNCRLTKVTDFSPLKDMPTLKFLECDFKPDRDTEILKSMKTLETINGQPVKEFWKDVEAKKP